MAPLLPAPDLEHVLDLVVHVATAVEVGQTELGHRRVIGITGGSVAGSLGRGRIQPGGADFQLIRPSGLVQLEARYIIELDTGASIYVENTALRSGPPDAQERIRRGEAVDPALIYFRCTPRFETAAPELRWMMQSLFLATGARRPDRVELSVYRVK